ncbi:3-hydroxyacyl-CoA dehydrogenase [Cryptococcus wingfieldii CBS 7118]|uniref:3-hydroxyacyl-CoA dehydrogenase n=1 Tax=Cryptococcus wingfieldii CBS 7118 TaxID=1295528 RepID=A0A1E3J1D5_9TREE|nr:3-hydroxyacyl-CoA dehydrogenase [Cryptococcus wingfieldii CBS 7118]ODN94700.1 3-hydroxyacyl-CoA dehydrogenase [Cryptococcus wingfieldii CBS 7118]
MSARPAAAAAAAAATRLSTLTRHLSTSAPVHREIQKLTVFGAGLMGAGIAQVGAQSGMKVILADVTQKALDNGLTIISKSLSRVAKKKSPDDIEGFTSEILKNISTTTDAAEAVEDADLVVEAIIESIKVKRDLFGFLDGKAKAECIFATNTSSLSVTEIAEACSPERQANFAGLHFFNPVPAMKLVEIIKTSSTSPVTFDALREATIRMGKSPVTCTDTPGFIVNRLLVPYLLEAARMVERGDATAEDIDTAMTLGAGYPMGPFKLLDFVGLDTTSYIAEGWREKAKEADIPEGLVAPIPVIEKLVKEGKLGRKSGEGFYKYDQEKK